MVAASVLAELLLRLQNGISTALNESSRRLLHAVYLIYANWSFLWSGSRNFQDSVMGLYRLHLDGSRLWFAWPRPAYFSRQYRISRPRSWLRRLGWSLTLEIDVFLRLSRSGFGSLILASNLPYQNKAASAAFAISRLDNPNLVRRA